MGATFPIKSPGDLTGKKMRSQESDVHLDTWRAFGASPVPIAVTEVLPSLQTGVVDGFDNTPLFTFAASWHQGITHFSLTNHIYQPGIIVLSKSWFDTLPADLQTLVKGDHLALAKAGRRGVRAIKAMLLRNFTDAGITLVELSDGERAAFKAKAPDVWAKFEAATSAEGKALLAKIKAAI
jgi:TRAP-type C4-dicarboxylate transport system substrate-binding protein